MFPYLFPHLQTQIAEALKNLGLGPQADAELRRIERQSKRAREPDESSPPPAPALKHPKLEPTPTPAQQPPAIKLEPTPTFAQQPPTIKLEPTAGVVPAAAVATGDPRKRVKREAGVVGPGGAAATPLQAGVPANQQWYEQLQQHAAQHQQQQQQSAKPLRQVCLCLAALLLWLLACRPCFFFHVM